MLADLAEQLSPVLETRRSDDPAPLPAGLPGEDDQDAERDYRELVDNALVNHHREALAVAGRDGRRRHPRASPSSTRGCRRSGRCAWCSGTRLDVSEDMDPPDPDDPSAAEYALYELLGQLQYLMVEVLAADLPDEGRPGGGL